MKKPNLIIFLFCSLGKLPPDSSSDFFPGKKGEVPQWVQKAPKGSFCHLLLEETSSSRTANVWKALSEVHDLSLYDFSWYTHHHYSVTVLFWSNTSDNLRCPGLYQSNQTLPGTWNLKKKNGLSTQFFPFCFTLTWTKQEKTFDFISISCYLLSYCKKTKLFSFIQLLLSSKIQHNLHTDHFKSRSENNQPNCLEVFHLIPTKGNHHHNTRC